LDLPKKKAPKPLRSQEKPKVRRGDRGREKENKVTPFYGGLKVNIGINPPLYWGESQILTLKRDRNIKGESPPEFLARGRIQKKPGRQGGNEYRKILPSK